MYSDVFTPPDDDLAAWHQARLEFREIEEAEQARRERVWAARHPNEWEEWQRVRFLLRTEYDFETGREFDFNDFLREVGRRPSLNHTAERLDESKPFRQGNMAWVAKQAGPAPSPYLNAEQAAARLGIATQTLYNNRRHIPSLPGFRTLMFDPVVLDKLRDSMTFRQNRLAKQRKTRNRKSAA